MCTVHLLSLASSVMNKAFIKPVAFYYYNHCFDFCTHDAERNWSRLKTVTRSQQVKPDPTSWLKAACTLPVASLTCESSEFHSLLGYWDLLECLHYQPHLRRYKGNPSKLMSLHTSVQGAGKAERITLLHKFEVLLCGQSNYTYLLKRRRSSELTNTISLEIKPWTMWLMIFSSAIRANI